MPITPMKIRTLQRKLYAKAKHEPGYRFYALNDKVFRADLLQHAWRLVKSNKGAPGIDGVSFADIEAEEGVEQFLAELAAEVRVIPASGGGSSEESACLDMKHIGKPCTLCCDLDYVAKSAIPPIEAGDGHKVRHII